MDDDTTELGQVVAVLKAACDREWGDETPLQVATIAANALHWRGEEIKQLRAELEGWFDPCPPCPGGSPVSPTGHAWNYLAGTVGAPCMCGKQRWPDGR
jgi:hypothetical protein